MQIAILTESRYENPSSIDAYVSNVLLEDRLLKEALEDLGCKVERCDWARNDIDFSNFDACIFRSTWDYFHRFKEFSQFLEQYRESCTFINSIEIIHQNIDKHYLEALHQKGICIPETLWIEKGDSRTLKEIFDAFGKEEVILKPCISGAARLTFRLTSSDISALEQNFKEWIRNEAFMLQPFIKEVLTLGEVSLMVFGGIYSHAVLKKAVEGDFRVQDDFGGTLHPYEPTTEEIAFAEKVVASMSPQPLYARVDVLPNANNEYAIISEVEMIEPELWFRRCPSAAPHLAKAIVESLKKKHA